MARPNRFQVFPVSLRVMIARGCEASRLHCLVVGLLFALVVSLGERLSQAQRQRTVWEGVPPGPPGGSAWSGAGAPGG